jgi:alkylation response protein AidB-like acyl-CoA dehydrogenase
MDFDLSEEQAELQRTVREVLARECPLTRVREMLDSASGAAQPWKSARELGWTAITVPEDQGGLGLGFEELGLVVEEHGGALPGPFVATTTQFLPLVREAGGEEQKQRFLGAVAAGELSGALAVAAAEGSGLRPDAALIARRDGDGYRLDGYRPFVLDGESADELAVVAWVEEGDGVGLFVVPRDAVKTQRLVSLDATRPLATLRCENVRVGPDRILGTPGRCAELLDRALDEARVALALETVGACQMLLDLSVAHAKQRVQFDRPIGAFQAIQHKCADMLVALEKARATAYYAMMTIGEDDPRRRLAASMAKAAAGDCQRLLCKEAIQIHGGVGFTWECDVHLFVKRAKTGEALLGTTHQHRARIAELLGV